MGVGYNEAKSMLTRCKEDYNVALRDLLSQWDQRIKGVTREQLEDALDGAEVGGLCYIVRKHYEKGSPSTYAASEEDTGDIVQRGEQVRNQAEQAPTVRKRVSNVTSAAAVGDDKYDTIAYNRGGGDNSKRETQQVPAVRQRGEQDRKQEIQFKEPGEMVDGAVDPFRDGRRGGDPTSHIKMVRTTETNNGNRSTTTFIWTGISKEHIIFLGVVVCVGVGLFFLNRINELTEILR
ncbi:uncharacterized protein LOC100893769 [Strongylocentrotus purpuratus]|uniref:Death domain-containing protein n=1 Tax=Strongylocentrotus purpuratus TaxID=7668 RepID=A0A7M7N143_STRPU|nr:uncharacterized protein LOC100893769 [Strongylocentrotus purpuratus]